jgi:hypothetical protein
MDILYIDGSALSWTSAVCRKGSDAVPTDGSTVALGLGHVPKESQVGPAGPVDFQRTNDLEAHFSWQKNMY